MNSIYSALEFIKSVAYPQYHDIALWSEFEACSHEVGLHTVDSVQLPAVS